MRPISPIRRLPLFVLLPAALAFPVAAHAAAAESRMTRGEFLFRAAHACPATGRTHGPCKGYVVDRVIPVVCGGEDAPSNMRWLTVADASAKARWDRIGCRPGRKYVYPTEAAPSVTEAFAADLPSSVLETQPLPAR